MQDLSSDMGGIYDTTTNNTGLTALFIGIIIFSLILSIIMLISTIALPLFKGVKATSENSPLDIGDFEEDDEGNEENTNNITNENSTKPIVEQTDKDNKNTASENDIPKTGVTEDITVVGFIIICVGSAIYAYRKIKKYNV